MENNKKQTAVDWLIEELGEYFPNEIAGIHLMVAKAKAMEKEQIEKSYIEGCGDYFLHEATDKNRAEQYYNETYNGKEN